MENRTLSSRSRKAALRVYAGLDPAARDRTDERPAK